MKGLPMSASASEIAVHHNIAQQRFEYTADGHLNEAAYQMVNGVMMITHTQVHPSLEGRGIAGALVRAALEHARSEGLKVDPACAYARAYMQRHPETQDLHV
jgi:uncharacterized protein